MNTTYSVFSLPENVAFSSHKYGFVGAMGERTKFEND